LTVRTARRVQYAVALGKMVGGKIQEGSGQPANYGIQNDHATLHG
jgi:hypothetical protein